MNRFVLLLALTACGGKTPPPATPVAKPAPAPAPAPEPVDTRTLFGRLHDHAGPIAGLDGFELQRRPDPRHCGGVAVTVVRTGKPIPVEDQPIVPVLELKFPSGLNFTADKEASLARFNRWVSELQRIGMQARDYYLDRAKQGTPAEKAAALARVAQVTDRFSSLLARAELPVDVATGEFAADKTAAFCEKMAETAEPVLAQTEHALALCAETAKTAPAGWWSAVCVTKTSTTGAAGSAPSP